jgi:hypothetical protein
MGRDRGRGTYLPLTLLLASPRPHLGRVRGRGMGRDRGRGTFLPLTLPLA